MALGRSFQDEYSLNPATNLNIAAGAIVPTQGQHTITAEGGLKDELITINKVTPVDGDTLLLRLAAGGQAVTIAGGGGNIRTPGGKGITLSNGNDEVLLHYNALQTRWEVTSWCIQTASPINLVDSEGPSTVVAGANPGETEFSLGVSFLGNVFVAGQTIRAKTLILRTGQNGADTATYRMHYGLVTDAIAARPVLAATSALNLAANTFVDMEATIRFQATNAFSSVSRAAWSSASLGPVAETANLITALNSQALDSAFPTKLSCSVADSSNNVGNTSLQLFLVVDVA